mmetsp:Transcript_90879/g.161780  ORF Transcript_90879/g.161780 Transcript_90879/m.161780 type:complete len:85 (-) Transcript_90879:129-383(-)|eukprot:CAMPEP_0197648988 /NCGR_PEP_ID=MMETSP1338-20131121/28081_1 /TAXON_ID=43686 ORGANISM="Pelagodinium beii, Strain RCC1491" /NCGR_SAMPLE_ID=MMETSP1338 /ASSEMBLY_ACC=CAM_ASM_000754 /LENGTH=84 /DNA_ID=CAMNT_0043223077 /DNA_START=87 /DNA_END=341 /DNA_ORIENTATION=-
MLDCFFGLLVGTGIGAYNAQVLRPCLDDTYHVTKQKGGPMVEKAKAEAGPAMQRAKDAAAPHIAKVGDSVKPMMKQLSEKFAKK